MVGPLPLDDFHIRAEAVLQPLFPLRERGGQQREGRGCHVNPAPEAGAHKLRDAPRVVRVCMRDEERAYGFRVEAEFAGFAPVAGTGLRAVKGAAVDQNPAVFVFDDRATTANFAIGMFYFVEELYSKSEIYLERAARRRPDEPTFFNNLAIAQLMTRQFDLAEKNARRALELLPDSPEVKDTLRQVRKRAANKRGGAITRRPGLAENPAFARSSPEWRPERPRDGRSARGTASRRRSPARCGGRTRRSSGRRRVRRRCRSGGADARPCRP